MCIPSLHLTFPGYSDLKTEAPYSTPCRITLVAIGVVGTVAGVLILFKIPFLSSLGTSFGWGCIGGGVALMLAGNFIKCVKSEAQRKKEGVTVVTQGRVSSFQQCDEQLKLSQPNKKKEEVKIVDENGIVVFQQGDHKLRLSQITYENWKKTYGEGPFFITLPKANLALFTNYASLSEEAFLNMDLDEIAALNDEAILDLIACRIQNNNYLGTPQTVVKANSLAALLNAIDNKDDTTLCRLLLQIPLSTKSKGLKILNLFSTTQLQDLVPHVSACLLSYFPVECFANLNFSTWSKENINAFIFCDYRDVAERVLDSLNISQINQIMPQLYADTLNFISSKHLRNPLLDLSSLNEDQIYAMFPSHKEKETAEKLEDLGISQFNTILPKINLGLYEGILPKKHLLNPDLASHACFGTKQKTLLEAVAKAKTNKTKE